MSTPLLARISTSSGSLGSTTRALLPSTAVSWSCDPSFENLTRSTLPFCTAPMKSEYLHWLPSGSSELVAATAGAAAMLPNSLLVRAASMLATLSVAGGATNPSARAGPLTSEVIATNAPSESAGCTSRLTAIDRREFFLAFRSAGLPLTRSDSEVFWIAIILLTSSLNNQKRMRERAVIAGPDASWTRSGQCPQRRWTSRRSRCSRRACPLLRWHRRLPQSRAESSPSHPTA
mmetsp:Transcript_6524/g.18034  ORF Transcript_6524/g.18034 Transcript_6524/m.18034 type:complete len:233 (-) Transcript_6524:460-1158(-)